MYDPNRHSFCSEFYTIAKSIEVVVSIQGKNETIRIEALQDAIRGTYCTASYIKTDVTLQPTYPQTNGSFDRHPEDFRIWVRYDLPWTDRGSADEALEQALGFLRERCSRPA